MPVAFASPVDKNAIRVVEPPAGTTAAMSGTTNTSSAQAIRASIPGTVATGTLNQSLVQSRAGDFGAATGAGLGAEFVCFGQRRYCEFRSAVAHSYHNKSDAEFGERPNSGCPKQTAD